MIEGNEETMTMGNRQDPVYDDNNDNNNTVFPVNKNGKSKDDFRVFKEDEMQDENKSSLRVALHYRDMRSYQTVEFYRRMEQKYTFDNGAYRCLMTMEEAFDKLENYVDASDPDFDLPNRLHLLQTAQAIRRAGHPDWFQLVGLLHDVGKIMFLWGTADDGQDAAPKTVEMDTTIPSSNKSHDNGQQQHEHFYCDYKQWALGGDTFVVGCRIPDEAVVFPQYNILNPDMHNPNYNTECGMYEPHCGLDQLCFAWGHDEYMYRMLVANTSNDNTKDTIPRAGLDIIRYHSAYPLHEQGAYQHLLRQPEDGERLEWVRLFNQFDLYTKDVSNVSELEMETLWPYYKNLLDKYGLGGTLKW